MLSNVLLEIVHRMEARAGELEHYSAPAPIVWRQAACLVAAILAAHLDEVLDLDQAAAESGYTPAHLRRLLGLQTGFHAIIPNCGTTKHPLIRRVDLPRKPGHRGAGTIDTGATRKGGPAADGTPSNEELAAAPQRHASLRSQVARAIADGKED